MTTTIYKEKPAHWPTLNTVIMVEKTLKKINESVISIAELKRKLPKQVNHNTLMIILRYLIVSLLKFLIFELYQR